MQRFEDISDNASSEKSIVVILNTAMLSQIDISVGGPRSQNFDQFSKKSINE